ncbi:MAG: hypothetical protein GF315_03965 [candidate division Zixibacteria bacterium]|nr:hypothetical protein [candidate division Zixibacteria bacterium]
MLNYLFYPFREFPMVLFKPLLVFLLVGMILFTYGCSVKKPEAPRWDTRWTMPLSSKQYTIQDIVDEMGDDNIIFDEDGNPGFEISETIDTFEVGERLNIDSVEETFAQTLGEVEITAPPGQTITTSLDEILPINQGIVPPADFEYDQDMDTFGQFQWALVSEGMIYVEVANQLEIDLDELTIEVVDIGTSNLIGTVEFPGGIDYGETKIDSINLAGKTIGNEFRASNSGSTPGGVLLNLGPQELTIDTYFSEKLKVTSAQAKTPAISREFDKNIQVDDSTVITNAAISSGSLIVTAENKTNQLINLSITIPNITLEDEAMVISGPLPANQSGIISRDLASYTIVPNGSSAPQTITAYAYAAIPSSGDNFVLIEHSDSIVVTAGLSELSFSSITGAIKPTEVEIEPSSKQVDIPEGLEQATLTNATLYLNFYNNIRIDSDIDITLTGSNSKTLLVEGTILGKESGAVEPRKTTITVEPEELSAFLDPPPNQIDMQGSATLNPDGGTGTVATTDYIYGDFLISSPLAFSIADTADIDLDIETKEISDDAPDFDDRVHYMVINADITSHLPVGAEVSIYISTLDDSSMYDDPDAVVVGPMYLNAAPIDDNGYASGEANAAFTDSLTSADVEIFENDRIYIGKKVKIYTPDSGSGITIRNSDYINISATALAEVEIGGDN